jgi:hypothetical protein
MLSNVVVRRRILRELLFPILFTLLLSCSSGKADEETFSLYLNNKSYVALISTMQTYSLNRGYRVTFETLIGASPENTSRHIMLDGSGVRFLIQSALAEQCKEREGRRDVEYSSKVFDVNAFSTSYFKSNIDLSREVKKFKDVLDSSGFRVISKSESCHIL